MSFLSRMRSLVAKQSPPLSPIVGDRGNWWFPVVREPFTGAWQRNQEITQESVLTSYAVYACIDRIASDVSKCRFRLVEEDANGIWNEISVPAFSPVLTKPNSYQNRIQFFENWIISKLTMGNTYVYKERDNRRVVTALHVLDPMRVKIFVAPDSSVYYQIGRDWLMGLEEDITYIPASEIIHDMMPMKYHPLCGVPPLVAASGPAIQGLNIQRNSSTFFGNNSYPGGILTAPGPIDEANAKRLKEYWDTAFKGDNTGKIAVLSDGLHFEPMRFTAESSQLAEQVGLSAQMVCSAFGVPAFMVGVGPAPTYNNIEALNQQYYSQTLQKFYEAIELLCDEGLGLTQIEGKTYGTEFNLDDLLRMDTATLIETEKNAVGAGIKAPNEARKRLNLKPLPGGDAPYMQQQNFSLEALAKRDERSDPFAKTDTTKPSVPAVTATAALPLVERRQSQEPEHDAIEAAAIAQLGNWALKAELNRYSA
jgi:HK97 family phage portal protein